jgi:ketosteroid isomerase-like protein
VNSRDPKLTALLFNECINGRDIEGLSGLMTDDHTFIDRRNEVDRGKESMTRGWMRFFAQFPEYQNTFTRVESRGDLVILLGYADWTRGGEPDHVIWTATIRDDLVAEWRIHDDTPENRDALQVARRRREDNGHVDRGGVGWV